MIHTYFVNGMTCEGCVSKVKKELLSIPQVISVEINLNNKTTAIEMSENIDSHTLNQVLKKAGSYSISERSLPRSENSLVKFMPLIIIFSIVILLTLLRRLFMTTYEYMDAMADFMGFFFVIFGGLKIINWKGFVESYSAYDILAGKSKLYGYVYPLIEVGLGIAYLYRYNLALISVVTLVVMIISSIGVAHALKAKKKIVCACLGGIFKVPMTKVTLMEDLLMAAMSILMLTGLKGF